MTEEGSVDRKLTREESRALGGDARQTARAPGKSRVVLICPVCARPLTWDACRVHCPEGHSFDLSREGYANLLLANQRGSNRAGDSREMVEARRAFLGAGHYAPLSEAICGMVEAFLGSRDTADEVGVLDVGCGAGYYLGALFNHVGEMGWEGLRSFYGLDISKPAVRLGAREFGNIRWAVANLARKIPFGQGCFDVLLSVFAPRNAEEFRRVVRSDGLVVVVVPGQGHLAELRECVMDFVRDLGNKASDVTEALSPAFRLVDRAPLKYPMALNREMLSNLVRMTPIYWKSSRPAIAKVEHLEGLKVTASFEVLSFV